ncbi:preQ(1) synthase [Cognatishimia activa]|uniref:NADPH-dependent 7-cyano-7-deazaguanine reductase n=1 Tax=Cognatishimia activa TaxID=1715691 RepID=A0A0P1IRR4_9RHOB|nr:preQ(1) synthase [Cognatishimia activa]CUI61542.1 NADPH-dependent 7-cyano-7-deazaguanine reductase [Cognatishimia activa]CUK26302.1 NADPH-dependent 7-cyano-7-deazaguanine reductase [Cognatishimia activa]
MSDKSIYENLTQLGSHTALPQTPEEAVMERVPNPQKGTDYAVRFTAPEFTSLCPLTSAPDFAHIVIDYVPGDWLVESKSLKLFLGSFRNHGAFHEDCSVTIGKRIEELLEPKWLRVGAYWYPRGGIPIDVFYQTGPELPNVWIPEQGVPTYRGRG